jgi:protein tyrosine phosphatase (PTP) superfamily phosphohydrolase (DUF442 family)
LRCVILGSAARLVTRSGRDPIREQVCPLGDEHDADERSGCDRREPFLMTAFDWMRDGPAIRGTPFRRRIPGRGLVAVGLLAAVALSQTGCRSAGCGSCGLLRRTTARIFNHKAFTGVSGGCCGDVAGETFIGDAPMSYPAPGVVVPGPSSTVAPAAPTTETPDDLNPLPEPKPKAGIDRQGSSGIVPKTGYGPVNPSYRSTRPRAGNNLSQASANNPVPASRSARGPSVESRYEANDTLDRLPPLDLPAEVTERTQTPPAPPAAERSSAGKPKPAASDKGAAPSAETKNETSTKVPEPEKTTGSLPSPPLETSNAGGAIPGIKRLVAVEIKLAAGSAPTREGLDWLARKGYKTLLDLREPAEVQPSFIADVTGRGMRYVALPMNVGALDADHVDRFNFELSTAEARPLFFFDSDGTRPGALWYVRRVTHDNFNAQLARREAEEIGLSDQAYWVAAKDYVNKITAAKIGQLPDDSDFDPATAPASAPGPGGEPPAIKPSASLTIAAPDAKLADAGPGTPAHSPHLDPSTSRWLIDPSLPFKNRAEWHPIAAVVMTGLTVPLAYWTRSIVPTLVFTKPTASLSATARQPKSIPDSSGE